MQFTLTLIGMSYESKKNAQLLSHLGAFSSDSISLAGCQINPNDVNFQLQKVWKFLIKKSADNVWSKKDWGWKVPSLKPIKGLRKFTWNNFLQSMKDLKVMISDLPLL